MKPEEEPEVKYEGLEENLERFKYDLTDEKTRLLFSIAYKQGYDRFKTKFLEAYKGLSIVKSNVLIESTLEDVCKEIPRIVASNSVHLENGIITVEQEYEMDENEKNDDDCCDVAREMGDDIILALPFLEVSNYYCHRHKYSIVELKRREHEK